MCGVFGFIGKLPRRDWTAAHQLMVELAVASEVRGVDAAGFAALTSSGDLLWQRQPGPARELFRGPDFASLRQRNVVMAIGHTRLATTGAPAVNGNNHPHLAGDWALVHNGFMPAHEEKAARLQLPLHSQCDSELLAQALCHYGERAGPDACMSFGGKQSVLAINVRTQRLFAWTNGEMPLVAFRAEGISGLWWASTEEIASEALEAVGMDARFAEANPGLVYQMEVRDRQVVIQKERTKGTRSWRRA
jgi:glutamine phosphoribosylpyrophosphate amidotransferase